MSEALHITFDFLGERQVNRKLLIMSDRCADLSGVFEELHSGRTTYVHRDTSGKAARFTPFVEMQERQFGSEGTRGGAKWADLKPRYKAWKDKHYPGRKILERTGALSRSLSNDADPEHIKFVSPKQARFGTTVDYAIYHQHGTRRMAARKPVLLTKRDRADWMRMIQRRIVDSFDREERADMRVPAHVRAVR